MSLMDRERHEELLAELLGGDLQTSRLTEILQELRADHVSAHEEVTNMAKLSEKLQRDNDDLIVSNSKLFRQAGIVGGKEDEKVDEKEFSETVTIEQLEGGNIK